MIEGMNRSSLEVKICGLMRAEDVTCACEAGADYLGFIRAESPRAVDRRLLADLVAQTQKSASAVLLYLDQTLELIVDELRETGAKAVQLHGQEPPQLLADLRSAIPEILVIKAVAVGVGDSPAACAAQADRYRGLADVVLIDAPKGSADKPDLAILIAASRAVVSERKLRVWLAGGLTSELLAQADLNGAVHGVDVARGVELSPGTKSPQAVRSFMTAARAIQPAPLPNQ
jgi:phosphoribosylanthranilate isomerase